ncbi:uncharacterized protein MELLADRAFT_105994 [Melampsora larici-populina 98AG31]|uniref:Uncharacterized protein n=1 Tax=Melampsora larici-populina (strain 98AG31 / pathotype 3-4-7) TaxID=747676 RepID=F4RK06_MELLP|nr:uncharacterized protein MELLADRAFT_105994 [Melampsora larici-populina 98AG31]EGG07405.1 hypothetical protein MELLADRAFT_105994 [Melampsora larici-populina 98AG31]
MKLHGARRFVRKIQKLADKLKNRVRGPEGLKRTPMAEKLNQRLRGPEDLRRTLMAEKLRKRLRGPEDPQRIPMALIESVASIPMDAQLSIENDDGTPPSESESTRDTCFKLARKQFGPAEIKPIASKTGPALIASTSSKYLGPHDQALSSSKNVASVTHKVEKKYCDFSLVPLRKRPYNEEKGCQVRVHDCQLGLWCSTKSEE